MKNETKISKNKTSALNDGVKNADEKGNLSERLNMPTGSRNPPNTSR